VMGTISKVRRESTDNMPGTEETYNLPARNFRRNVTELLREILEILPPGLFGRSIYD
jgi:hypothetical protein